VFEMGTGVAPPPSSPENCYQRISLHLQNRERTESSQVLDLLVPVSLNDCSPYTPGLSTSSSTRGLTPAPKCRMGNLILGEASRLDAFSVYPVRTWLPSLPLARQLVHQRSVHPGPLVLGTAPLKFPSPAADKDRTVSRRSEPSSRIALMGEQPNPWDVLPPQDAMSRHRGAKPPRRCELLGEISLLSPG
jgi:hypothetical protein